MFSVMVRFATSKTKLDISYNKLSARVASRVAEQTKITDLRKLGNIRKISNLGAQSPFQKLNFHNSSQKTRKSTYQTFLALPNFIRFLYFIPNILSGIAGVKD